MTIYFEVTVRVYKSRDGKYDYKQPRGHQAIELVVPENEVEKTIDSLSKVTPSIVEMAYMEYKSNVLKEQLEQNEESSEEDG